MKTNTGDGQQIGGVRATNASHMAGQSEVLNVLGNFAAGQHVVVVNFINDDYAFDPAKDRNLYLDSATIDGTQIGNADLVLDGGGPQTFSFGQPPATITVGAGPDTLALAMSEDAYLGDAQFTLSVDGAQVGGLLSTTALHAMGQSQTLDVMGSFATGPHTISLEFVNDAYSPPDDRTSMWTMPPSTAPRLAAASWLCSQAARKASASVARPRRLRSGPAPTRSPSCCRKMPISVTLS